MSLAWYVAQVATNMEDKVQDAIAVNIAQKLAGALENGDNEQVLMLRSAFQIDPIYKSEIEIVDYLKNNTILVPKEKVEEMRNGKKRETDRKIFPGYLLIHMIYNDELGLLIRRNNKITFIGAKKDSKPVPIDPSEVANIFNQVQKSQEKAKYKIEFEVGEKIRIIDGPFIDFNAIIEDVIYGKTKLRVNVQIFGRETAVELDFNQVEKI